MILLNSAVFGGWSAYGEISRNSNLVILRMARFPEMVGCWGAVVLGTDPGFNCVEARGSSIDLQHLPSCQLQLLINDPRCVARVHLSLSLNFLLAATFLCTVTRKSVRQVLDHAQACPDPKSDRPTARWRGQ